MSYPFENISDYINLSIGRLRNERSKEVLLFLGLCIAINLIGGIDSTQRKLLYLDMLGTALAGIALGPWWGASVGLITNLILYLLLPESPSLLVFALVNILGGIYWGYMCNFKLLRPIEGITSILNIFHFKEFKKAISFILMSGGLFLTVPVLVILNQILGVLNENTRPERYLYYLSVSITDKLLCVIIGTVLICSFFPGLATHLVSKKTLFHYGLSTRSIIWFSSLYLIPFITLLKIHPSQWLLWSIPYLLVGIALFKKTSQEEPLIPNTIRLTNITYGALAWLGIIAIVSFIEYFYFASIHITKKYDLYFVDGITQYKHIIADGFSLSSGILLMGIVFAILIQALRQRENREILRRVEWTKDKIATEIHNDPLQLISILQRKIPTTSTKIKNSLNIIEDYKTTSNDSPQITQLNKNLKELDNSFCNYYGVYLPQLDNSIRKIIKPLSEKDSYSTSYLGLIQAIKDLIHDFTERNPSIISHTNINITEKDLPEYYSGNGDWKIEVIKILKEGLINIEKHSQASKIELSLIKLKLKGKQKLLFRLTDNGKGFSLEDSYIHHNSFGMYEIQTRTKEIGGNITIKYLNPKSVENKGTIIDLEIPYN